MDLHARPRLDYGDADDADVGSLHSNMRTFAKEGIRPVQRSYGVIPDLRCAILDVNRV
jgi:hypothetical protein